MRGREPLVSIIIPVYNRATLIQETLQSVKKQSYSNWELILVDDGSTDDSLELLKTAASLDPRIYVFQRPGERLKGGNAARNYGFEMSSGEYVNWFDSDDIMHADFLKNKVQRFEEKPDLELVFSRTIRTNFKGEVIRDKRLTRSENLLQDFITRKISWYLPDGMFSRNFLQDNTLFDEDLLAGQDRDFYIRLFAKKIPIFSILDFYGTFYRMHENNVSQKLYREGNVQMQVSHYYSLLKQVETLKKFGEFNSTLKSHYLMEIKKRLPAIARANIAPAGYFKNLLELSELNKSSAKVWCQIIPAYISFMFFGKGERFIK